MGKSANNEKSHSTVPLSREIEEEAEQVFRGLLPMSWQKRKRDPDYFIDYYIEIVESGELTGLEFGAQLKGVRKAKSRRSLSHVMETKHLSYYLQNARLPVFIFLIDVAARSVHWVFSQRYIRDSLKLAQLSDQKTVNVRFDARDTLADFARFRATLAYAEGYMRDIWPGSVASAIARRQRELAALDSRIDVRLNYYDGKEIVQLRPTSEVKLQGTFQANSALMSKAIRDFVEHGERASVSVQGVTIKGSPLIETLVGEQAGRLLFDPVTRQGNARIEWPQSDGPKSLFLTGNWRGGTRSATFEGDLLHSPLGISSKLVIEDMLASRKHSMSMFLLWEKWENRLVSELPWLDDLMAMHDALAGGHRVLLTWFVEGVRLGDVLLEAPPADEQRIISQSLRWFEKCRRIAKYFGTSPKISKYSEVSVTLYYDVEMLGEIVNEGVYKQSIAGRTIKLQTQRDSGGVPQEWRERGKAADLNIRTRGTTFDFFGVPLRLEDTEHIYSDVYLIASEASDGLVTFNIEATASSEMRFIWHGKPH